MSDGGAPGRGITLRPGNDGNPPPLRQHLSIPWAGGGIAVSLLYRILLFSTLITLMSTALQLYFDFRRGVSGIEERFDEIRVSTVPSMSNSLWVVDHDQLRLLLNVAEPRPLPDVPLQVDHEVSGKCHFNLPGPGQHVN